MRNAQLINILLNPIRMAKKNNSRRNNSRNSRRGNGIMSYIYRPISEVIGLANDLTRTATNTVRNVVHTGASTVNRVGSNVTSRADRIIGNVVPLGLLRSKSRKNSRKNSRKTKKTRSRKY